MPSESPTPDRRAPTVYLAHRPGAQGDNVLRGARGTKRIEPENAPAILISFFYLPLFEKHLHRYAYREWVLDSGAYSAKTQGVEISLRDYIAKCHALMEGPRPPTEIFGLDVIGDHRATLRNVRRMVKEGIPAIPTYHVGEPVSYLHRIAEEFPKIALGGAVGYRKKLEWAELCFGEVWPCRIHGFGFGAESQLQRLPWHSVDATNWEMTPCARGRWKAFGNQKIPLRGSDQNLRVEIEWYLRIEAEARRRWRKEMRRLDEELGAAPTIHLALASRSRRVETAFAKGEDECES